MNGIAVGRCPKCDAMVNICWPTCLVCHTPITTPPPETGSPAPTSSPTEAITIQPGDQITWQLGAGGKVKEGMVDFLPTYPGEVWAFCTLPDGEWTAVNVKYIRKE